MTTQPTYTQPSTGRLRAQRERADYLRDGTLMRQCTGGEIPDPSMRLPGSLASAVWAFISGASVVRVHDVRATSQALQLLDAVYSNISTV